VRIGAQRQSKRRRGGVDSREDDLYGTLGIAWLHAVDVCRMVARRAAGGVVIIDLAGGDVDRTPKEVGAKCTRLDDDDRQSQTNSR
jgi:hypothetical protein